MYPIDVSDEEGSVRRQYPTGHRGKVLYTSDGQIMICLSIYLSIYLQIDHLDPHRPLWEVVVHYLPCRADPAQETCAVDRSCRLIRVPLPKQHEIYCCTRSRSCKRGNIDLCIYLSMSIWPSMCISVYLFIYLSIYLSICLSVCLSNCLSIYLDIYLSTRYLSIFLSVCISVY